MTQLRTLTALLGCAVISTACSKDDDSSTSSGKKPTITITAPTEGATATAEVEQVGTDVEVAVELEFTVTDFTLKEPGTCGSEKSCGQVFVKVDGDACNDTEATGETEPFNELIFASPGDADLLYCPGVTIGTQGVQGADGKHTISLELHADGEKPEVLAEDSVSVTVEVEAGGAAGSTGTGGAAGASGAAGSGGK